MQSVWKHRNHEITFSNERAEFVTRIGDKIVRSPSLDAAKKKIDAHLKQKPFDPFKALATPYFARLASDSEAEPDKPEAFTVNNIEADQRRRGAIQYQFITDRTSYHRQYTQEVTPYTPENRKLIAEFNRKHAKAQRTVAQMEKELSESLRAIPRITASQYASGNTVAAPDTDSD